MSGSKQNSEMGRGAAGNAEEREDESSGFKVVDRRKVGRSTSAAESSAAGTPPSAESGGSSDGSENSGVGSSSDVSKERAESPDSSQERGGDKRSAEATASADESVPEPAKTADSSSKSTDSSSPQGAGSSTPPRSIPRPPVDFSTLLLSFASTAMIQLGAAPHPETGEQVASPELAKETIDLLGLLREKTQGNLSDDETRLFEALLHDLRMKYLEITSGSSQK